MPGVIEFPEVVKKAMEDYKQIFANEPERRHFAEYLTGLIIAERKTVLGINQEFSVTTDQSCLNRFLTEVDWDVQRLNARRLELMQKDPRSRYSAQGVVAIDNVLIDHSGKLIEDVGWYWDHAEKRYTIAHDYLIANYVCTSGKHYPLEFRLFRARERAEALGEPFRNHTALCIELVDWVLERQIPGDFTFDNYFSSAEILNHIHGKGRGYVGDLKSNRKVKHQGQEVSIGEFAKGVAPEAKKAVRIGGELQWYFTKSFWIRGVDHRVRIVLLWEHRKDREPAKILITNRVYWEVSRILRVYRRRWTGTETFHRDGKQSLGMGDCQLRSRRGQTLHMYLVFVAYSLLMFELKQVHACEWALVKLTTIGEACRAVLRDTLRKTIRWALSRSQEGWSQEKIVQLLAA